MVKGYRIHIFWQICPQGGNIIEFCPAYGFVHVLHLLLVFSYQGTRVFVLIVYPNSRSTEVRSRLLLRSTVQGANNRLDIESIVSYDRERGAETSLMPSNPNAQASPDSAPHTSAVAAEHSRGMNTCVFIPWEQVRHVPQ
jgi:hypothetical protein